MPTLSAQVIVSSTPSNKNVLLEHLTGINSFFCPDAHRISQQIKANNPNRVHLLSIHTGSPALPTAGQPDYRSTWGDYVGSLFLVSGYPIGAINRTNFGAGTMHGRAQWAANTSSELNTAAVVNVGGNALVDLDTRNLTLDVEAYYTAAGPGSSNNFHAIITQDHVPGPQQGGTDFNPAMILPNGDYNHMGMVRHNLSPNTGNVISNVTTSSLYSNQYNYTIPQDYNGVQVHLSDLNYVLFVSDSAATGTVLNSNTASNSFQTTTPLAVSNEVALLDTLFGTVCGNAVNSSIRITNSGFTTLNTISIECLVNNSPAVTYNHSFNPALPMGYYRDIDLLAIPGLLPNGQMNTLAINITQLNGLANPNLNNSTHSFNSTPSKFADRSTVRFNLTTDAYGSETTWALINETIGDTVLNGGPYQDGSPQTYGPFDANLINGNCYKFEISDAYGDGICCDFGNGNYSLTAGSTTLSAGSRFEAIAGERFIFNTGGLVFNDTNQDCNFDPIEVGLSNHLVHIQPINIYTNTSPEGYWHVDSLPAGNYTATVIPPNGWQTSCAAPQSFTIVHPDSSANYPAIGLYNLTTIKTIDHEKIVVKIFPNPTQNSINIQRIGVEKIDLAIIDQLGRTLLQKSSEQEFISLHLGKFPKGLYYLHLHKGNERVVRKVVLF